MNKPLSKEQQTAREQIQKLFGSQKLAESFHDDSEPHLLCENRWIKVSIFKDGEISIQTSKRQLLFERPDYSDYSELLDEVLETIEDLKIEEVGH